MREIVSAIMFVGLTTTNHKDDTFDEAFHEVGGVTYDHLNSLFGGVLLQKMAVGLLYFFNY